MTDGFQGAKVAILVRGCVVSLLRDDRPGIAWPGYWDLPGGGREGGETPADCVRRETLEETGLHLEPECLDSGRLYRPKGRLVWFFTAHLPGLDPRDLRLGDEGQALRLMPVAEILGSAQAIPSLKARLRAHLGAPR